MSKIRIIYIEDEKKQRHTLGRELSKQGFEVTAASSGQEGLVAVKKNSSDVILCDLNMPDMSGLEVLKEIRSLDKEVPVILLTAHGSVEQAVKALKHGATDFLLKPLQIHKITATINNVIEKGSLRQEVKRSQSRLQMLMENVPDMVYSLNEKGEFLSANQATEHLLGYKPAEIIGTSVFDYIYPEDRKKKRRPSTETRSTRATQPRNRFNSGW